MLKITRLSDVLDFRKNNGDNEVVRFGISKDTYESLNQKIN